MDSRRKAGTAKKVPLTIFLLLISSAILQYVLVPLTANTSIYFRAAASIAILVVGIFWVFTQVADVIEETTDVLSKKSGLAGGLLQAVGTAFPDMILGVVASVKSLLLLPTNPAEAVGFAIIAASVTFASNIYNVGYTAWALLRQNIANQGQKSVALFSIPKTGISYGEVLPVQEHHTKPSLAVLTDAENLAVNLTLLVGLIAVLMVIFGQTHVFSQYLSGDVYELTQPMAAIILILAVVVIGSHRHRRRQQNPTVETDQVENFYEGRSTLYVFLCLAIAAVSILFTAEAMVQAIQVFSQIFEIPLAVTGVLTGIVGCLGEIMVVHNYTLRPNGRIGDAIVGVVMDNLLTIVGVTFVAFLGGVYLGGSTLILIFVVTLTANAVLVDQIDRLKETVGLLP